MSNTEPSGATAVEREGLGAWVAPAITALLGFAAVCAVCWPGFMSPDSAEQLVQARKHTYSDDHPPLMAMIWTVVDQILPGPAGMLVLLNVLYWGGLLVSFRYWPLPRRTRILAFVFVAAFPPLLVNLGVIWKDILMQGALVSLLASYLRYRRSHGVIALLLALVFSTIAIGVRHNSAVAVWPLLALFVAAHPRWSPQLKRWKHALGALAISLVLVVTVQQGVTRTLKPYVRETHFWQLAPLFDLAGVSVTAGQLVFDPKLDLLRKGTTIDEMKARYTPRHPGPMFYGRKPMVKQTKDPERMKGIAQNWLHAVREHPGAYLKSRWSIYRNLLGLTSTTPSYMVFDRIHRNPYKYELAESQLRTQVMSGLEWLSTTPLFRVWLYVLGCLLLFVVSAAAAYCGGSPLALALSASGIAYHATFAVLSCSDDYRYSLWTIMCSVLTACALPASLPEHWRARARRLLPPPFAQRTSAPST